MHGTFRTTLLALSILTLNGFGIGNGAAAQAEETSKKANGKKLASISISTPKKPEQKAKKANSDLNKNKRRISTKLPDNLIQNDQATLSDDEITRIKLIKRYEGVPNPRTDWNHGLRTLNWHYTESNSAND